MLWEFWNQGLSDSDFVELFNKGHASLMVPTNIVDERIILDVVKTISASNTDKHVCLRLCPPVFTRFLNLIGLKMNDKHKIEEFAILSQGLMLILRYEDATISIAKCAGKPTKNCVQYYHYLTSISRSLGRDPLFVPV
ncbi:hypothetical protein PENTCL1PPCAC_9841, partial [Pristionchus entomophagus]